MNTEEKLLFLQEIKARKSVLFGKFSDIITRDSKLKEWAAIKQVLVTHNVQIATEKDLSYLRDVAWPNLKRYTIEKVDKKKKTGSDGGYEMKLSQIDN